MTTQVITRPARTHRRRAPIVVLTALVLAAVVGIVTATVALSFGQHRMTHTLRERQAPPPLPAAPAQAMVVTSSQSSRRCPATSPRTS